MKRIVPIILLLLVIAVLAAPYLVGMRVEKRFMEWVATANQEVQSQWGDQSSVKVVEYQRGWLSSRAKVEAELRLEQPNEPPHTLAFTNSVVIEHGPMPGILQVERRLGWAWLHSQAKAAEVLAATLPREFQEEDQGGGGEEGQDGSYGGNRRERTGHPTGRGWSLEWLGVGREDLSREGLGSV